MKVGEDTSILDTDVEHPDDSSSNDDSSLELDSQASIYSIYINWMEDAQDLKLNMHPEIVFQNHQNHVILILHTL